MVMDCENGKEVEFGLTTTETESRVIDLISHFGEEPFLLSTRTHNTDSEQETIYKLL